MKTALLVAATSVATAYLTKKFTIKMIAIGVAESLTEEEASSVVAHLHSHRRSA